MSAKTSELLGLYVDILNTHNGPDAEQAKRFVEEHKDNQEFMDLVRVSAWF